jgi:hypothetical protein
MRRTLLALLALAAPAAVLGACGDDGGGGLSAEEREYADAWAVNLSEDDDGIRADDDDAECMAVALVEGIGIEVFEEHDVAPEDVEDGDSPGEMVGDGVIPEADARTVVQGWEECADLPLLFAESAREDFQLDDDGVACVSERLAGSDAFETVMVAAFTSGDGEPEDDRAAAELVTVVTDCSSGADGEGGGVLVDSVAESLLADGNLDEAQAQCLAQSIVDTIGQERLIEQSLESGDFESAPPEFQQEMAEAVVAAAGECGVPPSALAG